MKHHYRVDIIAGEGLSALEAGLEEYENLMTNRIGEVCRQLAEIGKETATEYYSGAYYDGDGDVSVSAEPRGENCYAVVAGGSAVLFIEFGAGLIGYGHPDPMGFGPGTYPGKGHWNDPRGWYYPGGNGLRTHGNVPNPGMYYAHKAVDASVERVVKDVFGF